jgi:hypothetical protein
MESFRIKDRMMRYSVFVPKLYNLCKSLGFEPEKIQPLRAFCADESQDFPIILIGKHFGAFLFNPDQVDLEEAITEMCEAKEVLNPVDQ